MSAGLARLGPSPERDAPEPSDHGRAGGRAAFGPTLALTLAMAAAGFLIVMAGVLLVVHPRGQGYIADRIIIQNQSAKTLLYVIAFAAILPMALFAGPRVADKLAAGPNRDALPALAGLIVASLAATVILVRLSASLPWGDGLGTVLVAIGVWSVVVAAAVRRAASPVPWPPARRLAGHLPVIAAIAGALVFGTILSVTHLRYPRWPPLLVGAVVGFAIAAAWGRVRLPALGRRPGLGVDVIVVALVLLAIPDVIVFTASRAIPNAFYPPGVIQFQHDWIIGPANQLLGGGTLLVNSPASQYGVGMLYFLAGWFHIVPIGYGTFGLLDGLLTAAFYAAGYGVLRLAGTSRLLAASALAVGVTAFVYGLAFWVGALPEQGPLRFGLPMALIVPTLVAVRWPRSERVARAAALLVLAISAIWALEGFAYTAVTFIAMAGTEAALRPRGGRRRWLGRYLALGAGACIGAHVVFAAATLAASGHLPDWNQYLTYLRSLLLGGREGSITYGFARWSPGLAVAGGALASAAAIVLLVVRVPALARRERIRMIALAGTTAYEIAVFSYADNRSSTYLLLYIALPLLLTGVLWLGLVLRSGELVSRTSQRLAIAFCLGICVLPVAASWRVVRHHFNRTALAHAYPGGGLISKLHRLEHPPPIDPRAREGVRLLARYIPGDKAIILMPDRQDLAVEILMRSHRTNKLFIGWGTMDSFVPSVWIPKIGPQIVALPSGEVILLDQRALRSVAWLRAHPAFNPVGPLAPGDSQTQWILREIDKRFRVVPIHSDPQGFVVAKLIRRPA